MKFSGVLFISAIAASVAQAPAPPCSQYDPTHKLETPCNIELKNSTYQVRIYNVGSGQQSFSTAKVQAADWAGATQQGFGDNFAYIEGKNSKSIKIPMTAPVLTRDIGGGSWLVSFFTPQSIYPDLSTTPLPTASNMYLDPLPLSTFAVLEFPGEANGISYTIQRDKLVDMLKADNITMAPATDDFAIAYAGYDAPNDLFNRHNEVWVKIILA